VSAKESSVSNRIDWHGEEAIEMVHSRAVQFVTSAAIIVKRRAQDLLSIAGTAASIAKGHKGSRVENAVRSKPGEPPRKQTGDLRNRTTYEVDADSATARVGTNEPKGKALEMGTKRGLLPRPWLRRALAESQQEIESLEGKLDQ
jgi:hypothetical protein